VTIRQRRGVVAVPAVLAGVATAVAVLPWLPAVDDCFADGLSGSGATPLFTATASVVGLALLLAVPALATKVRGPALAAATLAVGAAFLLVLEALGPEHAVAVCGVARRPAPGALVEAALFVLLVFAWARAALTWPSAGDLRELRRSEP
jgi:hypothetical protein